MNRKFKDALKQAYNIPEPSHKDEFLQKLESMQPEQKRPWLPFFVRYAAVPLTALAFLGMYGSYSLLSGVKTEYVTERPVHTAPLYEEHTADEEIQTTETSAAEGTVPEGTSLTSESGTTASDSTSASENMLDVGLTTTAPEQPRITTAPEQIPEQARTTTVPEAWQTQTNTTIASTTRITTTVVTRTATTTRAAATTKVTTTGRSTTPQAVSTTRQYDAPEPVITIPQTTTATAYTQTFFATTIGNQYEPTLPDEPVVITTTTESSASEDEIGRDLTVQPLHQYSILDNLVEGRFSTDYAPPADDINGLIDWKDLEEWSECIVSGEIEAVYYTSVDGKPWTQMDILVDEWWKGDINISDRISVYIPGGFMSLTDYISENDLNGYYDDMTPEEIAVSTVYEPSPEGFEPFVGMRYLFFLSSGGYSIPDGAYFPGSIDYFSLYRPRGTYYSPISSYLDVLTQEELAEYLW